MKRYLWLGAGFTFLLLLQFILISASILGTPAAVSFSIQSIPPIAYYIIALLGAGLWISYLRSFGTEKLPLIEHKGTLTLYGLALGLGLAGLVAWTGWLLPIGSKATPLFSASTLALVLLMQSSAWVLDRNTLGTERSLAVDDLQSGGALRDYVMLTKPIVLALLLVTTLAAMIVAAGGMPSTSTLLWTMIGGAFSAGGASALNQYIDRIRDSKMTRTKRRPLPEGRMRPNNVILFGTLLCVGGFFTLAIFVNLLSAVLALAGIVYYVIFYSLILKPTTTQNIVIGGGAGAIPPLVGWAAAVGELSMPAFFLFALVFFWTPPHFWALALLKSRDYARAGVPMLPVIHGASETRWQIMLYTVQVVALTLLLPLARLGGQIYFVAALLLGGGLVFYAWRLWRQGGNQLAYKMYRYSSTYLALLFAALVVDTFI
ncbi:MAG: heme o synthase [Anaerolineales bacterium]|jgi:protoheme IX farnesyltransferase